METPKPTAIARLSLSFIRQFRAAFLLMVALLVLGSLAYTSFLKREGFPPIEVPFVIVQSTYFVNDVDAVNEQVTEPIEQIVSQVDGATSVESTTTANSSLVFAEFGGNTTASEAAKNVRDELNIRLNLPEGANFTTRTVDAGSVDGEHDLVFFLSNPERSVTELQAKAEAVADFIVEHPLITEANVNTLITQETNPATGETFDYQSRYSRVGEMIDGELEFREAIGIGVKTQNETGTFELSDAVREEIEKLNKNGTLQGYSVNYGGDFAEALQQQFDSLESNAISGLLAVVIIVLLMVNWRASLLGVVFIPTVMAATFVGLYLIGYSLNVISLFALILVLGLIVDDAIVVVEAIDRKLKQGYKGFEAVKLAINDIGLADISGTITTMLVFVPMLFTGGILGDFIRRIPVTVILALLISLLVGLTLTPLLSVMLLGGQTEEKKTWLSRFTGVLDRLFGWVNQLIAMGEKALHRFITWYLASIWRAAAALLLTLALVGIGMSYAGKLTFSVFPTPKDTDQLAIQVAYLPQTSIEQAESIAEQIEGELSATIGQEVTQVSYFNANTNSAQLQVDLTPITDRDLKAGEMVEQLQAKLDSSVGEAVGNVKVSLVSAGPPQGDFPFSMQVYGEDRELLSAAATRISDFINGLETPGGVTVTDTLVEGTDVISKRDDRRYVVIRAKLSDAQDTQALLDIQAAVEEEFATSRLAELGLTEDALGFDFGQESENLNSFQGTIFATLVALIAMYALLVVLYNSFLQPILIFLAIPFSFMGLFPGLYFTDNALSFFVMLGILSLIGIAVNNTIMLVDYANRKRREEPNKRLREHIAEAVEIRFRPILTTTATTIAGLLPLALSDPFWEALSFSIIFGLISSTLMVLLFFPVFYWGIERFRSWVHKYTPRFGGVLKWSSKDR